MTFRQLASFSSTWLGSYRHLSDAVRGYIDQCNIRMTQAIVGDATQHPLYSFEIEHVQEGILH